MEGGSEVSDVVSDLEKLERRARSGSDMPNGLTQPQQLFYLSMLQLYALYHNHTYTKEQARNAKQEILSAYRKNEFDEKLLKYHADIQNRCSHILTEAEKSGCPICKRLVRVFDGREK